jgi:hypothetical protein
MGRNVRRVVTFSAYKKYESPPKDAYEASPWGIIPFEGKTPKNS